MHLMVKVVINICIPSDLLHSSVYCRKPSIDTVLLLINIFVLFHLMRGKRELHCLRSTCTFWYF